ncbi:hypothetical protein K435DRAFT_779063 [Dendrothele bispora CBS 962.96]|uniref:C2H2-type domain-containing protein n=1 Tax=Dendrothele bispora (strain CBS 962.96) TaxID=1314807 RepID=A0A4S8M1A5_DENBC|nr:hypothetical protein K435DRAFT_779063 [Dendrothele bispora CBS 962.96]
MPSSSDRSRRSGERPTLPPIRDLFADELSNPSRDSPALSFAGLRVRDDDDVPPQTYRSPGSGHSSLGTRSPAIASHHTSYERTSRPYYDYNYTTPNYTSQYPVDAISNRGGFTSPHPPHPSGYVSSSRHHDYRYDSTNRTPVAHHPPPSALYDPRDPRSHREHGNTPLPISTSFDYSRRSNDMERTPIAPYGQTEVLRTPPTVPTAAKYECNFCGKGFNRPSSLKIHLNSHTGERPFVCPVEGCGRSFSVLSNMRRHARVHTQGAPASRQHEMSGDEENEVASSSRTNPSSSSRWHQRRDSTSSVSTSSSGSRRSRSVSSDSDEEERSRPEKRSRQYRK